MSYQIIMVKRLKRSKTSVTRRNAPGVFRWNLAEAA